MPLRRLSFLAVILAAAAAYASDEPRKTWTFEDDAVGKTPRGFMPAVGRWTVVDAGDGKALAQTASNDNPFFNIVLVDDVEAKDVDLSVKVKAIAGEFDRGGGLIWRARDPRNYYVARYNHLEDNFRVYKVVDGKRSPPFQNADIKHHDGWTTLRVTMKGDHIECYYDGKKYLDVRDSTFTEAGKIGLWSKADARSQFDELTLKGVDD